MAGPGIVSITSGVLTADILTTGAELRRLTTAAGTALLWDGDPAVWRGRAPILFPVIGMVEGGRYRLDGVSRAMPKHGFARDAPFEVVSAGGHEATLRLTASAATRALYPFDFGLDIGFALAGGTLTMRATIANHGEGAMPASFGFHPALRWPLSDRPRDDHRLTFDRDEPAPVRRIDRDGLLTAERHPTPVVADTLALRDELFVDDALIFDGLVGRRLLYGAAEGPRLEIAFADFPTLGVWTKPGAGFICIEPWHGVADPAGFTGDIREKPGIFEVAPGEARSLAMSITLLSV